MSLMNNIYVLIFILVSSLCDEIIYPSLRYGINNTNFKEIEGLIFSKYLNNTELTLEPVYLQEKIDFIGTVELNIFDSSFQFFNLSNDTVKIDFIEPNQISSEFNSANGQVKFKYVFRSNFYSNQGKGTIKFSNTKFRMINNLTNIPNQKEPNKKGPGFTIEEINIGSVDLDFEFENLGPLEKMLQILITNLKKAIIEVIQRKFNFDYKTIVNKEIESYLSQISLSYPIENTSLTIDYSMNELPVINGQYLQVSFEVDIRDNEIKYEGKTYNIPNINNTEQTIGIIISQYIIDSYLYTMFKKDELNLKILSEMTNPVNLTVNLLSGIFSNITSYYDKNRLVDLNIKTIDVPNAQLNNTATFNFNVNLDVFVRNTTVPESNYTSELAVSGDSNISALMNISLINGTIEATFEKITMLSFKPIESQIGEIDEEKTIDNGNKFMELTIGVLNQQLKESLKKIQIPTLGNIHFDDAFGTIKENYIEIGVEPYINETEPLNLFWRK